MVDYSDLTDFKIILTDATKIADFFSGLTDSTVLYSFLKLTATLNTPLMLAINAQNMAVVQAIFDKMDLLFVATAADINAGIAKKKYIFEQCDNDGNFIGMCAIIAGDIDIAFLVVQKVCDIDPDHVFNFPLSPTFIQSLYDFIDKLPDANATSVPRGGSVTSTTNASVFLKNIQKFIVTCLYAQDNSSGNTLLMLLIQKGYNDIVTFEQFTLFFGVLVGPNNLNDPKNLQPILSITSSLITDIFSNTTAEQAGITDFPLLLQYLLYNLCSIQNKGNHNIWNIAQTTDGGTSGPMSQAINDLMNAQYLDAAVLTQDQINTIKGNSSSQTNNTNTSTNIPTNNTVDTLDVLVPKTKKINTTIIIICVVAGVVVVCLVAFAIWWCKFRKSV